MTLEPLETKLAKFDNDQHLTGWRWKVHNVEVLISDLGVEFGSSLLNPVHKQKLLSFCNGHINHEIGVSSFGHLIPSLISRIFAPFMKLFTT